MRRTMLYLPGNNPKMMVNGGLYGADGIILDLEDSVSVNEKDAARILVRDMLGCMERGGCETTVRINGCDTEFWKDDIAEIVPSGIDGIRIPKVDSPQIVRDVDEELSAVEDKNGIKVGHTKIFCLLESCAGVLAAYDIGKASNRVAAIIPGGEDLSADLRTQRSKDGVELEFARRYIVMAARAAGVDALDTVFSRVTDNEGLQKETEHIKALGYDGKSVIHPNQIPVIHDVFAPTEEEVVKARRIVDAARDAASRGLGVVSVDGRMVDRPVVKRAEYTLIRAGEISEEGSR